MTSLPASPLDSPLECDNDAEFTLTVRKWLASLVFSDSCPGKAEKSGSQALDGDRMYRILEVKPAGRAAASSSLSDFDDALDGALVASDDIAIFARIEAYPRPVRITAGTSILCAVDPKAAFS